MNLDLNQINIVELFHAEQRVLFRDLIKKGHESKITETDVDVENN